MGRARSAGAAESRRFFQGASEFDLPPDQRFYGGGSATVRGFKYQSIGPLFPDDDPIGGTQARVQIDLTRHLKLDTLIGTGGGTPATGATIDNDPGSSVGLTWQFDY